MTFNFGSPDNPNNILETFRSHRLHLRILLYILSKSVVFSKSGLYSLTLTGSFLYFFINMLRLLGFPVWEVPGSQCNSCWWCKILQLNFLIILLDAPLLFGSKGPDHLLCILIYSQYSFTILLYCWSHCICLNLILLLYCYFNYFSYEFPSCFILYIVPFCFYRIELEIIHFKMCFLLYYPSILEG